MFAVTVTSPIYCQITDAVSGSRTTTDRKFDSLLDAVNYFDSVSEDDSWDHYHRIAHFTSDQSFHSFDWTTVHAPATSPSHEFTMMDYLPF